MNPYRIMRVVKIAVGCLGIIIFAWMWAQDRRLPSNILWPIYWAGGMVGFAIAELFPGVFDTIAPEWRRPDGSPFIGLHSLYYLCSIIIAYGIFVLAGDHWPQYRDWFGIWLLFWYGVALNLL